jgi:CCR4-NOT transcription complex subunit 6
MPPVEAWRPLLQHAIPLVHQINALLLKFYPSLLGDSRLTDSQTNPSQPAPTPLQVPTTKVSIAHPFALHEAYDAAGYHLPFTHKVGQQHAVLDYMWSSRHMRVAAVMRPLQQEHRAMVDSSFLPNRVHPSDHLPIGAVLKLTCTAGVEEELQAAVAAAAPATKVAVAQAAAAEQRGAGLEPEGQGQSRGAANGDVHAVR